MTEHRQLQPAAPWVELVVTDEDWDAASPDLLRFAHQVVRATDRAEAFTFGTRLTRVTSSPGSSTIARTSSRSSRARGAGSSGRPCSAMSAGIDAFTTISAEPSASR